MSEEYTNGAPLYEALLRYREKRNASFHVPGHKNGQALRGEVRVDGVLPHVMEIDATEITGTDDLHHPEGVIREAQRLAAAQFGAEETFFLVGGSTAGNLALILSVCTAPGDVLLVQRNVHKSVIHGLMLAGAHAVFLAPQQDASSGLATIPSEAAVREALRRHPGAKGLLLTHPSYYGMGAPLRPLAELCHVHGVPLLVDEAHGAHFGQHPALPESALAAGADGVVQSTHKMLTALTMGAMLHVQGGLLDLALLRQRLAMLQSSSPSYPIMASLDVSRSLLGAQGPAFFEGGLSAAAYLRRGLAQLSRFDVVEPPGASGGAAAYTIQDPLKLVIFDATAALTGYELQERLEAEGCVPEMSDDRYVVLALGPGTTQRDAERLLQALQRICGGCAGEETVIVDADADKGVKAVAEASNTADAVEDAADANSRLTSPSGLSTWNNAVHGHEPAAAGIPREGTSGGDAGTPVAPVPLSPGEPDLLLAVSEPVPFRLVPLSPAEIETVPIEDSAGRQAAEMIIPYPPGIPIVYPGETVTEAAKQRLMLLRLSGAKCQGAADPSLAGIQVKKRLT
ncbi:aminotransferase class I/II-fold pyridoxal phosphate-dependent enzyme [Paenibacillus macerans]|uniref:aminotransferase class I/II-fold pyridoxal phosphate-dependent enzyme n=1 Tax=Paenibacillus macerans TaxID=44252 RepID=UPI003D31DF9A